MNSPSRFRVAGLGFLATALSTLCFTPLVHPAAWYVEALLMLAAAVLLGGGLRRLGLPRPATVLAQLLLALLLVTASAASSQAVAGILPGPAALAQLADLVRGGLTDVTQYSSPAPATPGLTLILVLTVLVVGVAVDALAATCGWAALAGLPLLAVFSVGTGMHPHDTSWFWFLLSAFGFLALLLAEGNDRLSRWGRVFRGTPSALASSPYGSGARPLSRTGQRVALLALVAALITPALLPATGRGLIDATGTGGAVINTVDPLASLQQSLNDNTDTPLMRYRTTDPDAGDLYLRIVDLDSFDGTSWQASTQAAVDVPKRLPAPEGLSPETQTTTVRTQVTADGNFAESWLPMPYPAVQVNASGSWQYEPGGRNLVGSEGQTTRGLTYSVTSDAVHPTAEQLRNAGPAPTSIRRHFLALPPDLPSIVAQDARAVTRNAPTAYDKAVALQTWFADSGEFTYNTRVRSSTGVPAIVQFLRSKQGFCVHFAATMAAMARSLGIPARVAVGFTSGTQQGDGSWVVGSKDAHAWPELYFSGAGWLRFEPTPSRGISPSYTISSPTGSGAGGGVSGSVPTSEPSAGTRPSSACPPHHPLADCVNSGPQTPITVSTPERGPSSLALAWIAVGGAVLLLLALPALLRAGRRARRLRRRQPPEAWREILDSAWDLGSGGPPDPAETPRAAARRLPLPPGPGREAADRVARATERALWSPEPPPPPASLRADVHTALAALRAPRPARPASARRWPPLPAATPQIAPQARPLRRRRGPGPGAGSPGGTRKRGPGRRRKSPPTREGGWAGRRTRRRSGGSEAGLLVPATLPARLHPVDEPPALHRLGTLLRRDRPPGPRIDHLQPRLPPTRHREHRTGQHHQESQHAQPQHVGHKPAHQQRDPDQEPRRGLVDPPTSMRTRRCALKRRRELGVFGVQRSLHLFEQSLLVIRERHGVLLLSRSPGDRLTASVPATQGVPPRRQGPGEGGPLRIGRESPPGNPPLAHAPPLDPESLSPGSHREPYAPRASRPCAGHAP